MDRHTSAIRLLVVVLLMTACTTGPEPSADPIPGTVETTVPAHVPEPIATGDDVGSTESGLAAQLPRGTLSDRLIWVDAHRIHKLHLYVPQPE